MIKAVERNDPSFYVGGFIDNDKSKHGKDFFGYPVLGGFEILDDVIDSDARFVNLITRSATLRFNTTKHLTERGAILGNFVHPSVDLTMVKIGVGNYIQEGVIVQAGVEIQDNCSIHMGALIGHETFVKSDSFIAHGVCVSGCCKIGQGCFLGTNATVFPRTKIGNWSIVGAGSVIRKNVDDFSIMSGNPAKLFKKHAPSLSGEMK